MSKIKKFIWLAVVAAIAVIVVAVVADEGTIRNALNALLNWVVGLFGLPDVNLF